MSKISFPQPSGTDWLRVDAMSDEDIDLSDAPEITPEAFAQARLGKKQQIAEGTAEPKESLADSVRKLSGACAEEGYTLEVPNREAHGRPNPFAQQPPR